MLFSSGIRPVSLLVIPLFTWVKIGLDGISYERNTSNVFVKCLLVWFWPALIVLYWKEKSNFSLCLNGVEIGQIDRDKFNKELTLQFKSPNAYLSQINDWVMKGIFASLISLGAACLIFWIAILWLAQNEHALLFDLIKRWSLKDDIAYYNDVVRIGSTMALVLWLKLIKNKFKDDALNNLRIELGQPSLGKLNLVKIDNM